MQRHPTETGADAPAIVADELALLGRAARVLERPERAFGPDEAALAAEIERLRSELPGAKAEDLGSLNEQLQRQTALLETALANRDRPRVDPESPYFAHLRLREFDGTRERVRDVCIGRATRIEDGVAIIDWRHAPVSQLFYRYRQGESYEEELGGRDVEGVVEVRRTLAIRDGALRAVYAPEGTFERDGAGRWQRRGSVAPRLAGGAGQALSWRHAGSDGRAAAPTLGRDAQGRAIRRDKHLPELAGLIDPEQFDVITRSDGFVVVRGAAGSGKTTVALHRVAWLAHQNGHVDGPRTLVLVFSRGLRDYVRHVLPALGVRRVRVETFARFARELRVRHFPRLPRGHREDTPAVVVALKHHPAAMRALRWQVERVRARPSAAQVLDDWANALTNRELLAEAVAATAPGAFDADELDRVARWVADQHRALLTAPDPDVEEADDGRPPPLDEEDDALLLYAWQRRVGPLDGPHRRPLRLLHAVIDEVQDFSPVDVQVVIGCLDRDQSLTLAGDTQQHVLKDAGFTSWGAFLAQLGLEGAAVDTLRVSYRCTAAIVRFAHAVLGPLREDDPPLVTREGPPVEFFRFTDHGAAVAFLAEALQNLTDAEPDASVAVLTPGTALSALYADGLRRSDLMRVHRVTQQDFRFAPGIEVAEVAEVKGLEFDYVVLVEVSEDCYPRTDAARRVLHVGATRAIHQLWMTSVGEPSPLLADAAVAS